MASLGGSSNPNPTKMFTFKTSDGELFELPEEIVRMFPVVRMFCDGAIDDPAVAEKNSSFPLPNVRSSDLSVIVNACKVYLAVSSKYEAVEKERQEFEADFFGQQSDETIVELVKAADYLYIQELLDFVMPIFRKRFGLGDDKGADFVYSDEFDTILLRRAASARTR